MASKMAQIEELKKELEYPTAKEVFDRYLELAPDNDDIDEAVYDVICEWDEQFAGDTTWCDDDEETDVKDRLRDEVLEMLGAMNTRTEDAVINNKNTKDNRLCVVTTHTRARRHARASARSFYGVWLCVGRSPGAPRGPACATGVWHRDAPTAAAAGGMSLALWLTIY